MRQPDNEAFPGPRAVDPGIFPARVTITAVLMTYTIMVY